jgi:hypothetical protein
VGWTGLLGQGDWAGSATRVRNLTSTGGAYLERVVHDEDVLGLDVTVEDAVAVHVVHGFDQLVHVALDTLLCYVVPPAPRVPAPCAMSGSRGGYRHAVELRSRSWRSVDRESTTSVWEKLSPVRAALSTQLG